MFEMDESSIPDWDSSRICTDRIEVDPLESCHKFKELVKYQSPETATIPIIASYHMNYFKAHSESLDASDFEKFYEYSSLKV
jgi:hypothetical protein